MSRFKRISLLQALLGLALAGGVSPAQEVEIAPWSDDPYAPDTELPADLRLIEGDIAVPLDWEETRATYDVNLWPNGVVPYDFGPNVTVTNQGLMRAAMDEWESLANVRFVPWTNENDYLFIRNATFNASEFIGPLGGEQRVWITSWTTHGTLVHELGHVLAYWHEQSRLDRNLFVNVSFANVCQNCCTGSAGNPISCNSQFNFRTSGAEHGPYDFGSVMHYGSCAFSCCDAQANPCPQGGSCAANPATCQTITVLPPNTATIGQRNGASYWDGRVMSFLYPESDWVFADANFGGGGFGTFLSPWPTFAAGLVTTPDDGKLWLKADQSNGPTEYEFTGRLERPMRIESTAGSAIIGR